MFVLLSGDDKELHEMGCSKEGGVQIDSGVMERSILNNQTREWRGNG